MKRKALRDKIAKRIEALVDGQCAPPAYSLGMRDALDIVVDEFENDAESRKRAKPLVSSLNDIRFNYDDTPSFRCVTRDEYAWAKTGLQKGYTGAPSEIRCTPGGTYVYEISTKTIR
jgi:hypothetical protein